MDRLIAETALEFVARRLRALGYDVAPCAHAPLDMLFAAAAREGRIVLTTSMRRPARSGDVRALVVPLADAAEAVRRVAQECAPAGPPFGRCLHCNRELEARPAREARGAAPQAIVTRGEWLWHCPACGRWYWHGSHVDRVRVWLSQALGRDVPGPLGPRTEDPAG